MNFLVILILCILATAKVTLQGFFAKTNIKTVTDAILFNGLIFIFASLFFLKNIWNFRISVVLFGIIFGAFTIIFQLCYIKAMSCGNVSLTVLIVNLSMVIPLTVSLIFYNEQLNILRLCGIILTFIVLILNVNKKERSLNFKKWFPLCLLASFTNGCLAICQQVFGKTQWKNETQCFVSWSYITAAAFSILLYSFFKAKGNKITFKIKPSVILYGLCMGAVLGLFQVINTKAISTIDSTLLFPTYNGGTLILSNVSSITFLKEKLKNNQKISILVGIIAIILLNL